MEKFKFALFAIVTLTVLGLVAYWSVATIQSGAEYTAAQKIKQLEQENQELAAEVKKLEENLRIAESEVPEPEPVSEKEPAGGEETKPEAVAYKHQNLINELQKMIDASVLLKEKSNGSRVGTVQKFLNVYNGTSSKIDNAYGSGTVSAVSAFQKASGLSPDGEAGASTFSKMIEWLKKQG